MIPNLKEEILELADIAKACPDNLQVRCFELLLEDFLASLSGSGKRAIKPKEPAADSADKEENGANGTQVRPSGDPSQEDFADRDLHVKARKFLKAQSLSVDHINQIFYKEGDVAKPLYEDLKTTKMAESQIRVALLQALKNALSSGEFEFDGEAVRAEVQLRKCYDPANFTAHFKNNKGLFDAFDKYDKQSPKIRLSNEGRDALANVIKQLQ
jgi:hypothetical protein